MPVIDNQKIFRWLWISWSEDDKGRRHHVSWGFTLEMATQRCLAKVLDNG